MTFRRELAPNAQRGFVVALPERGQRVVHGRRRHGSIGHSHYYEK
jgi:hypothetical protein